MAFKRISFFGLPLDVNGSAADICQITAREKPRLFQSPSPGPTPWTLAKNQPDYRANLGKMSIVVPDGVMAVAQACRFFTREKCQPLFLFDMTSFARDFFKIASEEKIPLIIVGGQPRDDEDTEEKLKKYFPGINIIETKHGYSDFAPKIAGIIAKAPKAVAVAIGAAAAGSVSRIALRDAGL